MAACFKYLAWIHCGYRQHLFVIVLVFQLADKRKISVREFKGKVYVDIREFYESDGELKPGKKG